MTRLVYAAVAAALLAAACGGDDDTPPPQTLETDEQLENRSASGSIAGLLAFARLQIARFTVDTVEPRPIDGIAPPTSESDEPSPL